jgi:hypothetical protein
MTMQICGRQRARKQSPKLEERIGRLRQRRTVLTQLIDSLGAYIHYAGQDSDLTADCHLYELSSKVPARGVSTTWVSAEAQ